MKHDIIKTDNYLLVVDESEITKSDWIYCPKEEAVTEENRIYQIELFDETRSSHVIKGTDGIWYSRSYGAKIIAHLPLNGSPILEGVDLLPPLEVDNSLGTPLVQYIFEKHNQDRVMGFCDGYNKAKEKYKYTEEDLRKAMMQVRVELAKHDYNHYSINYDEIIQSLSQPKMPIGFEFEAAKSKPIFNGEPKTLSNVVGFTQWTWEGTYIFN